MIQGGVGLHKVGAVISLLIRGRETVGQLQEMISQETSKRTNLLSFACGSKCNNVPSEAHLRLSCPNGPEERD